MPRYYIEGDMFGVREAENPELAACQWVKDHGEQREPLKIYELGELVILDPEVRVTLPKP